MSGLALNAVDPEDSEGLLTLGARCSIYLSTEGAMLSHNAATINAVSCPLSLEVFGVSHVDQCAVLGE